jgi:hypothetical protein
MHDTDVWQKDLLKRGRRLHTLTEVWNQLQQSLLTDALGPAATVFGMNRKWSSACLVWQRSVQ